MKVLKSHSREIIRGEHRRGIMMGKYGVELPIAGYVYLEVEAESEKEAIRTALEITWENDDIIELDSYEKLCEGNVMHVWHSTASVRKLKDEEEAW